VLTGMLSGFPSLHTPVWKLDALAGLGARDDPALHSAKRLLGSKRSAPAVVLCLQSGTIHQGVLPEICVEI
jgi:hypothetical protein